MRVYDVLIVGGGPAGIKAAEESVRFGLKPILFEKKNLGGVCLNSGCIPTKTLLEGVKLRERVMRDAPKFGIFCSDLRVDSSVLRMKAEQTREIAANFLKIRIRDLGVPVKEREAKAWRRTSSGVFQVDTEEGTFSGKQLILAVGGEPKVPDIPGISDGLDSGRIVFPRDVLERFEVPPEISVVGGGAIGLEFASIFSALGTRVRILEEAPRLAPSFHPKISEFLSRSFRRKGVVVRCGARISKFSEGSLISESGEKLSEGRILLACGWKSALPKACVPEGAYIVGDAAGAAFSASNAEYEAENSVRAIAGLPPIVSPVPRAVFSNPEIVAAGMTLERAREIDPESFETEIPLGLSSSYGIRHSGENGFGVCVYSGNGSLIGFQLVGSDVAELASVLCPEGRFIHPSLGEFAYFSGRMKDGGGR